MSEDARITKAAPNPAEQPPPAGAGAGAGGASPSKSHGGIFGGLFDLANGTAARLDALWEEVGCSAEERREHLKGACLGACSFVWGGGGGMRVSNQGSHTHAYIPPFNSLHSCHVVMQHRAGGGSRPPFNSLHSPMSCRVVVVTIGLTIMQPSPRYHAAQGWWWTSSGCAGRRWRRRRACGTSSAPPSRSSSGSRPSSWGAWGCVRACAFVCFCD